MRLRKSLILLVLAASCTGARVSASIEDEPVCPDFEIGATHTKMKGGLRKPVKVTVLDGDSIESERILLGRRTAEDPAQRVAFEDDDESLTVRWAQCENVRAPKRVDAGKSDPRETTAAYACGEAKVYKDVALSVREGDAASRTIRWEAPPEADCWTDQLPDAAPSASAAAPPPPPPPPPEQAPSAVSTGASPTGTSH